MKSETLENGCTLIIFLVFCGIFCRKILLSYFSVSFLAEENAVLYNSHCLRSWKENSPSKLNSPEFNSFKSLPSCHRRLFVHTEKCYLYLFLDLTHYIYFVYIFINMPFLIHFFLYCLVPLPLFFSSLKYPH